MKSKNLLRLVLLLCAAIVLLAGIVQAADDTQLFCVSSCERDGNGQLNFSGTLAEGFRLLKAEYDADGRLIDAETTTSAKWTFTLKNKAASAVRFFVVDGSGRPIIGAVSCEKAWSVGGMRFWTLDEAFRAADSAGTDTILLVGSTCGQSKRYDSKYLVKIDEPGITLKDIVIAGNLVIGENVGKGEVTLDHAEICGELVSTDSNAFIIFRNGTTVGGIIRGSALAGDLNGDGVVDFDDLALLYSHLSGAATLPAGESMENADVDRDGRVSEADATALAEMLCVTTEFRISETDVSPQRGTPGTTFEWTAYALGGVGQVEYAFELQRTDETSDSTYETAAASREYSEDGRFSTILYEAGVYAMTVYCRDESGTVCVLSDIQPVTVTNTRFDGLAIHSESGKFACESDPILWTVKTFGGNAPFTYQYTLYRNSRKLQTETSDDPFFILRDAEVGNYRLTVECTDVDGLSVIENSDTVTVCETAEFYPEAPVIRTEDENIRLSENVENAATIEAQSIGLYWDPVADALEYTLELSFYSGNQWVSVHVADSIRNTRYELPYSTFRSSLAVQLYRIAICSRGISEGEPRYSYICVAPVTADGSLTVDGGQTAAWDIASIRSAERHFTVVSELNYAVTSDTDWIICVKDEDGFTASVAENTASTTRSGTVTVDNGENTVSILIRQGRAEGAPEVVYPYLSTDPQAPTDRPSGGIAITCDGQYANYIGIRIYELVADGKNLVYEKIEERRPCERGILITGPDAGGEFAAGNRYMLELSGYYSLSYDENEVKCDVEKTEYYFNSVLDGHEILILDTSPSPTSAFEEVSVDLYSTSGWTCSADADWIHVDDYSRASIDLDVANVDITLEPNYTQTTRTGSVTFFCGDKSATVKITQESWLPRFTNMELSTDMAHPTMLPANGLILSEVCTLSTYATYIDGCWSDESSWCKSSSIREFSGLVPDGYFDTGVLHRFTLHSGECTGVYYVTFTGGSTQNYVVLWDANLDDVTAGTWSVPAGSSERQLKMEANAAWTVSSDSSWLSCSAFSGSAASSYKTLTVTSKENTTGSVRTGKLTFQIGSKVYATLTVTQAAADYLELFTKEPETGDRYVRYDPATSFRLCDGGGDSLTLYAWANDTWYAESNSSWISFRENNATVGMNSGKSITIKLAENAETSIRTGTVTVHAGNVTRTVTITQVPGLPVPTLVSPQLSTDSKNSSAILYDDMTLTWNAVRGAAYYHVEVEPADQTRLLPDSSFVSYEIVIEDTGKSKYSCTIPKTALSMNADSSDRIKIYAYDEYGYYSYKYYYFTASLENAARINGTMTPVWDNATDIAVSRAFTVSSTDTWTARSDSAWIAIDRSSGVSGDAITVSLSANTGGTRTGHVIVTVGGTETILTVNQCAYLPQFPSFAPPMFSEDPAAPTLIDAETDSIRVLWNYEPQAEKYQLRLGMFKSASVTSLVDSATCTGKSEYTFDDLELTPGILYSITLIRESHWGNMGVTCYFMVSDENAFVKVNDADWKEIELEAGEDHSYVTVTSSGTWIASTSDDWLMLENDPVTQAELDEYGDLPEYYSTYAGTSGRKLYISALANPGSTYRYGTVTVRNNSAEATITVIQEPYYEIARISSPVLSDDRQNPVGLPYGNVKLSWTSCIGGAGTYQIELEKRDPKNTSKYYDILEADGLTGNSYSIPASRLQEGGYYRVTLYSDLTGLDTEESPYQRLYFYVKYQNALTATADVVWHSEERYVQINASAVGGAGGYRFAYQLLCDGEEVDITEIGNLTYYTFELDEQGQYQVKVFCKDTAGFTDTFYSAFYDLNSAPADEVSISQNSWNIGISGGTTAVTVKSNGTWTIDSAPVWVTCSAEEGTGGERIILSVEANPSTERAGTVVFSSGAARATMNITQESAVLRTIIVYPFGGATIDIGDTELRWSEVPGATTYLVSVRDMTTQLLLFERVPVSGLAYAVPASSLVNGHDYRIAVGAVVGTQTWWTESRFSISRPETEVETECVHDYQRFEVATRTINIDDSFHEVITTYYERCRLCGDTTAQKTESVQVEHSFTYTGYEAAHEHAMFKRCSCGAAPLIEGAFKTANGQVQDPDECCICHGHNYDEAHPKEVSGKWRVYCLKCGVYKNVPAPASPTTDGCSHPNGYDMQRTVPDVRFSVNVNEKFFHKTYTSSYTVSCCSICGAEDSTTRHPLSNVDQAGPILEPHTFDRNGKCTVCDYISNEGIYDCTQRYKIYVASNYYFDNGKVVFTGIGNKLPVLIYDTYLKAASLPGDLQGVTLTLKDPDGIGSLQNGLFTADNSGICEIVLSYLGKKVDSVEIQVTVLSVEDTIFRYNIVACGVATIDDLNRLDWKDGNVILTSSVAIGKYESVQNRDGSHTVSFTAYNSSAEVIGFAVYDNTGKRVSDDVSLVAPHWEDASYVLTMVDTFAKTAEIWNSRSFDGSGTSSTKITLTVPEGGYIGLLDLSEDDTVLCANLAEALIGSIRFESDVNSLINPTDVKMLRTTLQSMDKKTFSNIIKVSLKKLYGDGFSGVMKATMDATKDIPTQTIVKSLLEKGLLTEILTNLPIEVIKAAGSTVEDIASLVVIPPLYYVKYVGQGGLDAHGVTQLDKAFIRWINSQSCPRFITYFLTPFQTALPLELIY